MRGHVLWIAAGIGLCGLYACTNDFDKFTFDATGGGTTSLPTGGAGGSAGGSAGSGGEPECVGPFECPGQDTTCQWRLCDNGQCTTGYAPLGTLCSESGGEVCNGNGQCVPGGCLDEQQTGDETDVDCGGPVCLPCENGLACLLYRDCESGFCSTAGAGGGGAGGAGGGGGGLPSHGICEACVGHGDCAPNPDTYCGGGVCTHRKADGAVCADGAECLSGHCPAEDLVCCGAACGGTCVACLGSKTGGADGACGSVVGDTDPDGECIAACNGSGACQAGNGLACQDDVECASDHCVDGFCCDTTCGGSCESCDGALSVGDDGTCAAILANTDPDAECTFDCDGLGACQLDVGGLCSSGNQCGNGPCVDGVCCENACSASCMGCSNTKTGQADGQCEPITTGTDPDGDCNGNELCYDNSGSGECRLIDGEICGTGGDCVSGFCPGQDLVCCNAPCSGTCVACTAAKKGSGSDGACGFVQSGTDPDDECAGAPVCDGGGSCI